MLSEPDEWCFAYNYLTDVTGALMFDYQYNFSVWVFFFSTFSPVAGDE